MAKLFVDKIKEVVVTVASPLSRDSGGKATCMRSGLESIFPPLAVKFSCHFFLLILRIALSLRGISEGLILLQQRFQAWSVFLDNIRQ